MPFKDSELKKMYHRKYYHDKNLREKQNESAKLLYWRKKFMKQFACGMVDCEKFTVDEMKEQCKSGICEI